MAFIATIRGRFEEPNCETEYRGHISSKVASWVATQTIVGASVLSVLGAMITCNWRQTQEVEKMLSDVFLRCFTACFFIEGLAFYGTQMFLGETVNQRIKPMHWVFLSCSLHRIYHVAYMIGAVDMSQAAMSFLVNGKEEMLLASFSCSVIFNLGIPISWHEQILTRVFLDGINLAFFQQVSAKEGIELHSIQRALGRFLLAIAVGFLNDWSRRRAYMQTLRQAADQALERALQVADNDLGHGSKSFSSSEDSNRTSWPVQADGAAIGQNQLPVAIAKERIQVNPYQTHYATHRVVIKISGKNDDAMITELANPASAARVSLQELLESQGISILNLDVRRGSVIAEIEASLPRSAPAAEPQTDGDAVDLTDYGQWLDALKLNEASKGVINDGDVVSVSVKGISRYFIFNKEKLTWTPLLSNTVSDASPLVPAVTSLLSRCLPCCYSPPQYSSKQVKEMVISAIWLEDELDQTFTSLAACGINLEAVLNGRPLPIRVNPPEPRKWLKGQLVNFIVSLPELCTPGIIWLNLWSTSDAVSKAQPKSSLGSKPCIIAASRPILLLPHGHPSVVNEFDHMRSQSSKPLNVDAVLIDIGRMLSAQLECTKKRKTVLDDPSFVNLDRNILELTKTNLMSWCRQAKSPHTLALLEQINFVPVEASAPFVAADGQSGGIHPVWVVSNVVKFTASLLQASYTRKGGPSAFSLLGNNLVPYLIIFAFMLKRRIYPSARPPLPSSSAMRFVHCLFVKNIGLLLHLHRLVNVYLIIAGVMSPILGRLSEHVILIVVAPNSPSSFKALPTTPFLAATRTFGLFSPSSRAATC